MQTSYSARREQMQQLFVYCSELLRDWWIILAWQGDPEEAASARFAAAPVLNLVLMGVTLLAADCGLPLKPSRTDMVLPTGGRDEEPGSLCCPAIAIHSVCSESRRGGDVLAAERKVHPQLLHRTASRLSGERLNRKFSYSQHCGDNASEQGPGPVAVRPMVGVQVVNSQVEAAVVSCMALSFHPAKAYKVPAFVGKGLFLSASCPYK
ncbi:hypothetical protein Anapl_03173 [Anas platyrhynchos]|uniref:Uncharacterized protein n=1 Tax=Anas platyrhynchos TaxID=8839 RepID=R0LLU5_ANAPL|nr:hypothetical protein Anapl_03173 [Anas platyrhynchos]